MNFITWNGQVHVGKAEGRSECEVGFGPKARLRLLLTKRCPQSTTEMLSKGSFWSTCSPGLSSPCTSTLPQSTETFPRELLPPCTAQGTQHNILPPISVLKWELQLGKWDFEVRSLIRRNSLSRIMACKYRVVATAGSRIPECRVP